MKLATDIGFDASFSFVYRRRPGSPAADLADDTPRRSSWRACSGSAGGDQRKQAADQRAMVGSTQRILVEGPSKKDGGQLMGAPRTTDRHFVPAGRDSALVAG